MMKKSPLFFPASCRRGTAILLTALLLTAGARPTDGRIRDVWQ